MRIPACANVDNSVVRKPQDLLSFNITHIKEYVSSIDSLPFSGSVKTYNVDYQTPDSAATASAYLTGVKGNYYTSGVNANVEMRDCDAIEGIGLGDLFSIFPQNFRVIRMVPK